jgi:two-component system sensor histidine kinase RpfC
MNMNAESFIGRLLTRPFFRQWFTRNSWVDMLSTAPRAELEQALLRVAIPAVVTVYIALDEFVGEPLTPIEYQSLWFALVFFLFAVVLAGFVLKAKEGSARRRIFGIVADNAVNTAFLLLYGEAGAYVFGIYLFVTFGNGFRYGREYLRISQVLSIAGFLIVLTFSPFWSNHIPVGIGILLALLVLPFYVGVLAERISEARRRADEANQAKGKFLANVSHEMRTPLNGVIAMADLLRETPLNEAQQEIVETLANASQLALAQIEDVLDAAKIEAGRVQIETRPFDLGRLLNNSVKVISPQARYKGLTITTDIDPSVARWFSGDPHHLRQVLLNLLANAVKFTERGGITLLARMLSSTPDGTIVRIEVKDTGIGIPGDKLATIFEAFAQADDSVTRVYGGTGLGTTIARQLVVLMGGRVGVESVVGSGSTFWVELPLPHAEPRATELADEIAASRRLPTSLQAATSSGISKASRIRGARVLVAEDNVTNQRVTRLILESGGHFATIVKNGEEALDALEDGEFDIALFDLSMPVVSGLEALKMYRFTATKPIPVLILSANVTTEAMEQCHAAGAAEFVQKPVRASFLLDAIDRSLAERAAEFTTWAPSRSDERPSLTVVQPPPLDPSVIAELANLSRDPTFEERLLRGVRSDCAQLVDEIITALSQRKYQEVSNAAHALKGAAGSVGAGLWVQFAVRLEKADHETLRLKAGALAQELTRITQRTYVALDAHIESRIRQKQSSAH